MTHHGLLHCGPLLVCAAVATKDVPDDSPFWVPSGKDRTSLFTAGDRTATHRRFWRWHSLRNSRRLRVSAASSTNTRSQLNSILRGQPGLWRSRVTKGGRSSYSRILAASRWIEFLDGTRATARSDSLSAHRHWLGGSTQPSPVAWPDPRIRTILIPAVLKSSFALPR
jgi:hypothetical protein